MLWDLRCIWTSSIFAYSLSKEPLWKSIIVYKQKTISFPPCLFTRIDDHESVGRLGSGLRMTLIHSCPALPVLSVRFPTQQITPRCRLPHPDGESEASLASIVFEYSALVITSRIRSRQVWDLCCRLIVIICIWLVQSASLEYISKLFSKWENCYSVEFQRNTRYCWGFGFPVT